MNNFFTNNFSALIIHLNEVGILTRKESDNIIYNYLLGDKCPNFINKEKRKKINKALEQNKNRMINYHLLK